VVVTARQIVQPVLQKLDRPAAGAGEGKPVLAELSGQVLKVLVREGDSVAEGDTLLLLELHTFEFCALALDFLFTLLLASNRLSEHRGQIDISQQDRVDDDALVGHVFPES
jgi:hypothetical protein